jgi:hypothetical protein
LIKIETTAQAATVETAPLEAELAEQRVFLRVLHLGVVKRLY